MSAVSGQVVSEHLESPLKVAGQRLESVDLLRGLVMVIMALDHTREFFTYVRTTPENLAQSTLPLFFARWITHFCAPTFFFLAGTGVFLSASRGKSTSQIAGFLVKRGAWLIILEFAVVDLGFSFVPGQIFAGVLWALGACMIILAALVWLPPKWVGILGVAIIFLHHLSDRIRPESFGALNYLWRLIHQPGVIMIRPPDIFFINLYVWVPWCGVMAAGYGFGKLLLLAPDKRRQWAFRIGLAATVLFLILRFTHSYGQPPAEATLIPFSAGPYVPQPTLAKSIMAFLNVCKYPPSLQFLLMTLGPALMVLSWFDRLDLAAGKNWLWKKVLVYGQVPMFYYILHIWLIHVLAILVAMVHGQSYEWLLHGGIFRGAGPTDVYGYGLPFIYLMWFVVVVTLYPACAWYARYKRSHKQWWLRYL